MWNLNKHNVNVPWFSILKEKQRTYTSQQYYKYSPLFLFLTQFKW